MKVLKIAIFGRDEDVNSQLIKNLSKNSKNIKYPGMDAEVEVGETTQLGRKLLFLSASHEKRNNFFTKFQHRGLDLGIVIVDSSKGVLNEDQMIIEDVKKQLPCMVFFNDQAETGFHNFGKTIGHGFIGSNKSTNGFLEFLAKMT
jgi:hypothetical protein